MTTYSATGFSFIINEATDTTTSFSSGTRFDAVLNEADTSFSYVSTWTSPGSLDEVNVNYSAYNVRIDGTDIYNLNGGNLPEAEFGTITWNNGGGVKTTYVLVLTDDATTASHLLVIGGDALPTFANGAAFDTFRNNHIQSFGSAPGGSGFGAGEAISYASIPGVTSSEDDEIWAYPGGGVIESGSGSDDIIGNSGDDIINPGDNTDFDYISGSAGNDTIVYSQNVTGNQTLSYAYSGFGTGISATVNGITNSASVNKGVNGTDTIIDIANPLNAGFANGGFDIQGTDHADSFDLTLNAYQWMSVRGGRGADSFTVQAGNMGQIRLDYRGGDNGVNVNLATGVVSNDGFGFVDTITGSFWEVRGTDHADTIVGSAANESFIGREGNDIIDGGGGHDRIRFDRSGVTGGVNVNLATGAATGTWNGNAFSYTLSNIEEVRGTVSGNDSLTGNSGNNRLFGYGGNDTLNGGDGSDELFGGDGDDILNPGDNLDYDYIEGSTGNDQIIYTQSVYGYQDLSYGELNAGVSATINGITNTASVDKGVNGIDTITDVATPLTETVSPLLAASIGGLGIRGSNYNDVFNLTLDSDQWMSVSGGRGADTITAQAGNLGQIRLDYRGGDNGVNINLATGVVSNDGFGFTDTLSGAFSEIRGTDHDDMIVGSDADERFIGRAGNDTIDGGGGNDALRFDRSDVTAGVTVNLAAGTAIGTWGGSAFSYTLSNIENVRGSNTGDDVITGNDVANILEGRGGNDTLDGGIGADRMVGGDGNDTYYVDNVGDTTVEVAGEGTDTVISSISFGLWSQNQFLENLILAGTANIDGTGNALANTLTGNTGNNVLNGGVGADSMRGGAGDDSYYVDNVGDTTIEMSGEGTDTVYSSVNFELWAQSQHIENLTLIGGGNLNGVGNALANTLTGNSGNNVLNGGVGADRMVGGAGDDSYYVDNAGDTTIEVAGQGTDTVFSSVNFELWAQSQHIENLTLIGGGNLNGVGNALDNTLTGNTGNNVLNGGVGADRMVGGAGDDSYYVDNAGDTTIEVAGQGTDTVFSSVNFELWAQSQHIENLTLIGGANLNGVGNALANTLTGNTGNNVLNGGVGADRMVGGAGDDSYYVDNAGDTTIEVAGQGTDTVFSSVNFELWAQSQHIENLTLIGGANLNGVGNALANTLTGNTGNNVLNGGVGADRMVGGAGNDSYYVDNAGDTTIELSGEGTDSVFSSVSYFLWNQSQHIENLTLIGTANIDGGGNGLANTITGNAGNNVLNGGGGADRMVGGAGNDTYHVDNAGDTTIEVAGQGTDSVISSVSYLLWNQSQHIENLTLIGTANIDGGGNGLANTITGNAGNNVLNGGGGADSMVGGQGDDTYYVDNFGDTTIEQAGEGTDLVMTSVGFALRDQSQHIENLTLIGTGHIYGTGNGLANTITGNDGNNGLNGAWGDDTLIGGAGDDIFRDDAGNDIFTGGTGADTFFFLSAGESDRITDFEDGIDNITIGLGVNSFANVTVTDSGADTILTFGSNTVTLENFDHTLVSSDDFTFV